MLLKNKMFKKAIYSILTAFLFIIVALIVVVGLISYSFLSADIESKVGDSLNIYDLADDVKDRLLYCYSENGVIDRNKLANQCDVPVGYVIRTINYGNCTDEVIKNISQNYDQKLVYTVPVLSKDNTSNCLAKMEILICSGKACSCIPSSNAQFCSAQNKSCGSAIGTDNCGATRTVTNCGNCQSGETCSLSGTCN